MPQFFWRQPGIATTPPPAPITTGYPGQAGNPVGYNATPANLSYQTISYGNVAYPGSLTIWPGGALTSGTAGNPHVYAFYDFVGVGTTGAALTALSASNNYITFIGCRFQCNDRANYNVQLNGATNITFLYCSFTPLTSLYTSPPGAAWPSAGTGQNTTTQITDTNCINGNSGYQYGLNIISGGPCAADHCDFWGFGNGGPIFYSTTAAMTVSDCWIHDPANASPQSYHIDGLGYLNGASGSINVTISHCTIAAIGNTNAIAFQASTTPYSNISITSCYLSGFGYNSDFGHNVANNTNWTVTDNVFATDVQWIFGPIYTSFGTMFTQSNGLNNLWRRNTLSVYPGSTVAGTATFSFTSGDNGKYLWPDVTLHVTDWPN